MKHELLEKICLTLFVVAITIINILSHFDIWFRWHSDIDKVAIAIFNAFGIYITYLVWRYKE